ncbi:hypothetical protein MKY34_05495 [Sporosarcina sp. FSL K6-1522]|uniref:hypothetical protein n=1 Tax=Sporosarcina sp. FSL K6-1522 TaxID=2921554 RepID=UPI00315A9CD2
MLISKKRKSRSKFVAMCLAMVMIATVSVVSAAQSTANLDGSGTSKSTSILTATKAGTGNIYATNNGANTTTRGYAKKSINWLPDSTVASTNWLNPGQSQTATFTQSIGQEYYGQIVGQTSSSRGGVRLTVN